jgi:hypothetical protein
VRVQQDGGRVGIESRTGPDDGLAPVGGFPQPSVREADVGALVADPCGSLGALLGRELTRIGHRPDPDDLGELLANARHQRHDAVPE